MKAQDAATLGVRLTGLAAVVIGVVLSASVWIIQTVANMTPPTTTVSLHETTYTHVHYNFGLMLLTTGLIAITGIVLIIMSRYFGRLLIRGLSNDVA